jgi:hypothetical protein
MEFSSAVAMAQVCQSAIMINRAIARASQATTDLSRKNVTSMKVGCDAGAKHVGANPYSTPFGAAQATLTALVFGEMGECRYGSEY